MKAIILYSSLSGHGQFTRNYNLIIERLNHIFEKVDVFKTESGEEARSLALLKKDEADVFIVAGGDGSFHNIVNAFGGVSNPPALAFFDNGTSSDTLVNLGLGKNYEKTLEALEKDSLYEVDIFKVNEEYCLFMAAIGAFSDIAYITPRSRKKRWGKMAYYYEAIKELFKKNRVHGHYKIENEKKFFDTAFVLLLNGKSIANFKINKKACLDDGKIELLYSEQMIFKGLGNYLLDQKSLHRVEVDDITIETDSVQKWCIDGEPGPEGPIKVEVLKKKLKIYCFLENAQADIPLDTKTYDAD